jgi:hypothetical protein
MNFRQVGAAALAVSLCGVQAGYAAEPVLVAIGSITGLYEDFASQTSGLLENGVPGNRFGGLGSGLAYLASAASARRRSRCRRSSRSRT